MLESHDLNSIEPLLHLLPFFHDSFNLIIIYLTFIKCVCIFNVWALSLHDPAFILVSMMHQQSATPHYSSAQAGGQHYQGQPAMAMMSQGAQGNSLMPQRPMGTYRSSQQGRWSTSSPSWPGLSWMEVKLAVFECWSSKSELWMLRFCGCKLYAFPCVLFARRQMLKGFGNAVGFRHLLLFLEAF